MTELSFLLDLLLNEKLSVEVKTKITERIRDIESRMSVSPNFKPNIVANSVQAPSTQKILDEMAMNPVPVEPQQPSSVAAAQALASRQAAIMIAASGKPEPGRTSPRKF